MTNLNNLSDGDLDQVSVNDLRKFGHIVSSVMRWPQYVVGNIGRIVQFALCEDHGELGWRRSFGLRWDLTVSRRPSSKSASNRQGTVAGADEVIEWLSSIGLRQSHG